MIKLNNSNVLNSKLKKESFKYIEMIRDTKVIEKNQIQEIKANLMSDYYFKSEIIDAIINKIVGMPNFVLS